MEQGFKALALGALLVTPLATNAALVDRGGGLIYDDVLKITWLQDTNYAKTSGYDTDGLMGMDAASTWASNLVFGGFDDWRLPITPTPDGSVWPCWGSNCTSSELGHMFYNNMGATAGHSILSGSNTTNLELFSNLQSYRYWSGTEDEYSPVLAWYFNNDNGDQTNSSRSNAYHAWAVRDGDVASAVPLPAAGWLLLSGLASLGVPGRRRKAA